MFKDVAGFVRNDVVDERYWCHDQPPIQADMSSRVTAPPPLGLVHYVDRWSTDSQSFGHEAHALREMLLRFIAVPVPQRASNSGALYGGLHVRQGRRY